jgi:hypothetical protein
MDKSMFLAVEQSMYTTIEQKSLGRATAQLTSLSSGLERPDHWFEAYLAIDAHVTKGAPLSEYIEMLASHENAENDWEDVHLLIQDVAGAIESTVKDCLELAKEGIADATIECELDSDVNTYDMSYLVDRGAKVAG